MPAAATHSGWVRRVITRSGPPVVALVGHLAVLFALGYESANEAVLGEPPAAITVEIVFAPSGHTTMASRPPLTIDDQSHQLVDTIDRPQTAAVEQQDEPPAPVPAAVTATAIPASTTMAAPRRSSSTPKAGESQTSFAKRQSAPLAIAPTPNPLGASDPRDGGSTGALGVSAAPSNVPSAWKARLLSHLERYKHYPDAARAQCSEGTALLSFGMDRDGRVLGFYLVRSSGCPELDDEVFAMIERASPLPPAPPEIREQIVQLVVPVRFRM
jgi:protein TonB